jgi:hypothetical protein
MRLTIVKQDKTVCKDFVCISKLVWEGTPVDVHALQWYESYGYIEYNDGKPNEEINALPQWALNALAAWEAYTPPAPPPIPSAQEENKITAQSLLYTTDWSTIPDVSDPTKSNPYLVNVQEFLDFRNLVRNIEINPPEVPFDFPLVPKAQWSDR